MSRNSLSSESGISVTLRQGLVIVAIIAGAGSAYGYMVYTQSSQGKDIADIKTTQASATATVTAITKDQEEKRTALGKEFLESNRAIVAAIGELKTIAAVQQERQKITDDKLGRVLDQIGAVLQQPSTPQRR